MAKLFIDMADFGAQLKDLGWSTGDKQTLEKKLKAMDSKLTPMAIKVGVFTLPQRLLMLSRFFLRRAGKHSMCASRCRWPQH